MSHFDMIKDAWSKYPEAKVVVKEVSRRSQLPKWQDCPKDSVYVGVIRRKNSDRAICVRHKIEADIDLANGTRFEHLLFTELAKFGFVPMVNHYCGTCGQFASRMNVGIKCQDCTEKEKEQSRKEDSQ